MNIAITWDEVTNVPINRYIVAISEDDGPFSERQSTVTTLVVSATDGAKVDVKVKAIGTDGKESAFTPVFTLDGPAPDVPTGLNVAVQ